MATGTCAVCKRAIKSTTGSTKAGKRWVHTSSGRTVLTTPYQHAAKPGRR